MCYNMNEINGNYPKLNKLDTCYMIPFCEIRENVKSTYDENNQNSRCL